VPGPPRTPSARRSIRPATPGRRCGWPAPSVRCCTRWATPILRTPRPTPGRARRATCPRAIWRGCVSSWRAGEHDPERGVRPWCRYCGAPVERVMTADGPTDDCRHAAGCPVIPAHLGGHVPVVPERGAAGARDETPPGARHPACTSMQCATVGACCYSVWGTPFDPQCPCPACRARATREWMLTDDLWLHRVRGLAVLALEHRRRPAPGRVAGARHHRLHRQGVPQQAAAAGALRRHRRGGGRPRRALPSLHRALLRPRRRACPPRRATPTSTPRRSRR
jgi:hypothetical protein